MLLQNVSISLANCTCVLYLANYHLANCIFILSLAKYHLAKCTHVFFLKTIPILFSCKISSCKLYLCALSCKLYLCSFLVTLALVLWPYLLLCGYGHEGLPFSLGSSQRPFLLLDEQKEILLFSHHFMFQSLFLIMVSLQIVWGPWASVPSIVNSNLKAVTIISSKTF